MAGARASEGWLAGPRSSQAADSPGGSAEAGAAPGLRALSLAVAAVGFT